MASEIIVLERFERIQRLAFYYSIPIGTRITIGNTSTNVVATPAPDAGSILDMVLDTAEKTALDAGEAILYETSVRILEDATDSEILGYARIIYAARAIEILADYESKYAQIGNRFDK